MDREFMGVANGGWALGELLWLIPQEDHLGFALAAPKGLDTWTR